MSWISITSKLLFYDAYKPQSSNRKLIIIDEQTNGTIGQGMII
jgi:sulfate adenylyltransferase subunit 1 (EFTu-like GTPase family)